MLKRFSIIIGVLFLCFVATSGFAAGKVLLEYNPKPGTATNYKLEIRGATTVTAMNRAQKTDLETLMTLTQKIVGVDSKGNINMETEITDGTITVNKTPSKIPVAGQIIKVKMAKNGEVLESEGMDQGSNFQQMQIKFPAKPIGVGETWETTISPNPQLPIPLKVKYTLVGFETVDGYECAKLQSTVTTEKGEAGSISLNVKADGKIWFAFKEGIMVKNEVLSTMVMIMENDVGGRKEKIDTRMNLNLRMGIVK